MNYRLDLDFNVEIEKRWNWCAERMRRYVPQPIVLMKRVIGVIKTYGPQLDDKTQKPLFDRKAYNMAKSVMLHISRGCLSDPPGINLHMEFKKLLLSGR